jgi:hypothetical protein
VLGRRWGVPNLVLLLSAAALVFVIRIVAIARNWSAPVSRAGGVGGAG